LVRSDKPTEENAMTHGGQRVKIELVGAALSLCAVTAFIAGCGGVIGGGDSGEVQGNLSGDSYKGCFSDDSDRALPVLAGDRGDMTPDACVQLCAGYAYAGVQYYTQCWCGNDLGRERRGDDECNTPCSGDGGVMCGGAWRNSIYSVGAPAPAAPPPADCVNVPQGTTLYPGQSIATAHSTWVYQGDGNLVHYTSDGRAMWASGTYGRSAGEVDFRTDGNLVIYDADGTLAWSSGTAGHPEASFSVCNSVFDTWIYNSSKILWGETWR
jgi:hypothetical protein